MRSIVASKVEAVEHAALDVLAVRFEQVAGVGDPPLPLRPSR